jgi:RNA polymerase sigma factor (sigma-70 family)
MITQEEFLSEYSSLVYFIINKYASKGLTEGNKGSLFNEVYLHLFREDSKVLKSYNGSAKLSTWLFVVIRAKVVDLVRKEGLHEKRTFRADSDSGEGLTFWEQFADESDASEEDIEVYNEKLLLIRESLETLDNERKAFISDLFFKELSTEDMMQKYGLNSRSSVYSRKNKIIEELKRQIRKEQVQNGTY